MQTLLLFELGCFFKRKGFYILLLLLVLFGAFAGSNFSLSVGPDVFKNAPYTIAFMTGFLSLFVIFFATILTTQILFKEQESNFSLILYATPLQKKEYLFSRFFTVVIISLLCFFLIISGFAVGQQIAGERHLYTYFTAWHYGQPLLVFGIINTFFCAAMLCSVGWFTRKKIMVYVAGLFIYILYMVMLIFSGSPLMAHGMPQSPEMVRLSATLDPFGLSAFFLQTSGWSVAQRNGQVATPTGIFLYNRLGVLVVAVLVLAIVFKRFSFATYDRKKRSKNVIKQLKNDVQTTIIFKPVLPKLNWKHSWASLCSFVRLDIKYITKSIPFLLTCIGLLFFVSMEVYGNIEKGIRIPQHYATSGLMAKTIIDNFHGLCLIIILYYANEIWWCSRASNFHLIEHATPVCDATLFFSKWVTLIALILFFTTLMVLLGLVFQLGYSYPIINWQGYAGVYLFTSFPLIITAGIILIVQKLIRYKYMGLIVSSVVALATGTSLGKKVFTSPLLRFQIPYNGLYSDMNGYGAYTAAYSWRILFGICIIIAATIALTQLKKWRPITLFVLLVLLTGSFFAGQKILQGYRPKNENEMLSGKAVYERQYRRFQTKPQPTVTDITTEVNLFPENNAYEVRASYRLQNNTNAPIDSILINFADNIQIQSANFINGKQRSIIKNQYSIVSLERSLNPGDTAEFNFKFSYCWAAVNGHESFNAIVQNGSFMRISRYYPTIGYMAGNEVEDEDARKKLGLGLATQLTNVDAPRATADDFIQLNMTISTAADQTAIGVGELVKKWGSGNRNFFQYHTLSPIPFRFAISSAKYAIATNNYAGKNIEIYYHPGHYQNVPHLIKNIQSALDYCQKNFGAYPFKTIRFAEVSAFTKGFAATAYPATIYMAEQMTFDANINADTSQDVINQLAGHELSHLWWGNSQIAPDEREGAAMLIETLAMYTELMLLKKMHGKKAELDYVGMHLGIYLDGRGFAEEQPLYKVQSGDAHLSYSKGVVVMYQLSELIGEAKVNQALKELLRQHAYPNASAISTDFLQQLYAVADSLFYPAIYDLFTRITLYDFTFSNTSLSNMGQQYKLTINANASKYYEDGKGLKTKLIFNDSVEVAIYSASGKEKRLKLPVKNSKLNAILLLDEKPITVELDPDIYFIRSTANRIVQSVRF